MIKKGIISSVNTAEKKARVLLTENNFLTSELPYSIAVMPNDVVLVAFLNRHFTDGIIFQNLSRTSQAPGDTSYIHHQIVPSSTWTITHNLGKYPSVTVVDSSNNVVVGDIQYIDQNTVKIMFTTEFAGKAYLN